MDDAAFTPSFSLIITHAFFFLRSNLCARHDVALHTTLTLRALSSFGHDFFFFFNLCDVPLSAETFSVHSGMNQQADGGFGGPGTPQSPLLSPRMAHAQSPMMQQGQGGAAFQGSPEMNGWTQSGIGGNR